MEDNILKEIRDINSLDSDMHKINSLNETLNEVYAKDKEKFNANLSHITETFKTKLKNNPQFASVVENYVNKYVTEDVLKDDAQEEMFLILTGELLGMFRGISQNTVCNVM